MYCRVCVSHHCIVYTYFLECVFPPALCDAGNPDALTRSGLLCQVQKGISKKKRKNKSQPDTQNVADIVFIIYISLTKKVRRNSSKVREGMQLLLYSGVASTNFALYPSVFHLNKHFFPKTKNRPRLQPILTNGSSKCCNLHTFLC